MTRLYHVLPAADRDLDDQANIIRILHGVRDIDSLLEADLDNDPR